MKSGYKFSKLVFEPVGDGRHYILKKPLLCTLPDGTVVIVPSGFVTDLASTPDIARIGLLIHTIGLIFWLWPVMILGAVIIFFANYIGNNSKTDEAAVLHDWRYWNQDKSFNFSNWELLHTLQVRNSVILAVLFYINVQTFGILAWKSDAKRRRLTKASKF